MLQKLKEKDTSTKVHKNKDIDLTDNVVDGVINDIVEESEESEIQSSDDEKDKHTLMEPKKLNTVLKLEGFVATNEG